MQQVPLEDIIKIQAKGLITIPKKMRDTIGVVERSLVRLRADQGKITIEPVRTLPYPVRSYTDEEIDEFFALDEAEGKELRRQGIIK